MKKIIQSVVLAIAALLAGYSFAAVEIAPVIINGTFIPALTGSGTVTSVTGSSPTSGVVVTVTNGTTTPNVAVALTNLGVSSVNATSSVVAASFSGAGTGLTGTAASLTVGNATTATNQSGGSVAATTLSASSTVSGTGFSTYLASPPAIGGSTAANGTFAQLAATSGVTVNVGGNSTGLTDLLINPTTKTSGNLFDAQINGVSKLSISYLGSITVGANINLNGSQTLQTSGNNTTLGIATGSRTFSAAGTMVNIANQTATTSSGNLIGASITPTIVGTSTAGYVALLIQPTETSTGSGSNLLLTAGTAANPSLATIDNKGRMTAGGGYSVPFTLSQSSIGVGIPPAGTFAVNSCGSSCTGQFIIGSATAAVNMVFSGTGCTTGCAANQTGVTATCAGCFGGTTALDVGRMITVNDSGTFKTALITAAGTTGTATVTIGNLSTSALTYSNSGGWYLGWPLPAPYTTTTGSAGMGLYLYEPQGAINSVSAQPGYAAGEYWTVCTYGTICTAYNNTYSSGEPLGVASPTAFSGATGAASAGATGAITLRTNVLAGGTLGINGFVEVMPVFVSNGTANTKVYNIDFGGISMTTGTLASTNLSNTCVSVIRNQGTLTNQYAFNSGGGGNIQSSTLNPATSTINTASNVNISIVQALAPATDFFILAGAFIRVTP